MIKCYKKPSYPIQNIVFLLNLYDYLNQAMKEKIVLHDKTFVPFISNEEIEKAIDELAARMNAEFKGCEDVPVLLCILNGAILFTAELMKRLDFPIELMSMKLSSYTGTHTSGEVKTVMGITGNVKDRMVIIVEDIVDTGNTIVKIKEILKDAGAKDSKVCTLLLKPEVYKQEYKLDYVGKSIPNAFIVGFGLDYDELGRNLPDIYVLGQ